MSQSDDAYYRALEQRQLRARLRLARREETREYRIGLLKKVRSGEITLAESQALAKNVSGKGE